MNLDPQDDPKGNKTGEVKEPFLEKVQEEKKLYTIFVDIKDTQFKKEIEFSNSQTIEDAIYHTIDLDSKKYKNITMDDLEIYFSSKKGKPKDDYPTVDKTRKIAEINYPRFIIMLSHNYNSQIKNSKGNEDYEEILCFCFKVKKQRPVEGYNRFD